MRLGRAAGGSLQFERTYVFDYSLDGVTLHQGFVVMAGRQVEAVGLQ
jgi:hypothetical protein